jgi:recombination protein RecT
MAENEIVEKKVTFSAVLTEKLDSVSDALPKDFNKTRFVQNAVALITDNETLIEYKQTYGEKGSRAILAGLLKGAYLGLDFISNEAYLVPYKSKLSFMPSYRGCVKLVQKYSIRPVKNIYADVVRRGDDFSAKIIDGKPTIDFSPLPFNDDDVMGAFAVCEFQDGGLQYEVMSYKDLEQTRKASKMRSSGPWEYYTAEMYKKTVIHRLCKHIQIDFDNPEQYKYFNEDNEADFGNKKPQEASLNNLLESEVIDEE